MIQQSVTVAETSEERWQQIPEDVRDRFADSSPARCTRAWRRPSGR
jgi:predicted alternative tryptophan synthase beta-subunit